MYGHKSSGSVFTMTLKLKANKKDLAYLDKVFRIGNRIYNRITAFAIKQLRKLHHDREFQDAMAVYGAAKKSGDNEAMSKATSMLNQRIDYFGLTRNDLEHYGKEQQHKYSRYIDYNTMENIASAVYQAVSDVMYKKGRKIHFRKLEDELSLSGETNKQGIRYIEGALVFHGHRIETRKPSCKDKQRWYYDAAMKNSIRYVRIKRKAFGSGWEYYCELVFNGTSPKKHPCGKGNGGIDSGPSIIAAAGNRKAALRSLGLGLKKL